MDTGALILRPRISFTLLQIRSSFNAQRGDTAQEIFVRGYKQYDDNGGRHKDTVKDKLFGIMAVRSRTGDVCPRTDAEQTRVIRCNDGLRSRAASR